MNKIGEVINKKIRSKSLRYGTNSVILIIVVLALVVFANLLVGMSQITWDLTPTKLFSISNATRNILNSLDKDVYIYGFIDSGKINNNDQLREITQVLSLYGKYKHIKIKYINPDKNPSYMTDIYPSDPGRLEGAKYLVKCGNKIKTFTTEQLYNTFTQDSLTKISSSKVEQDFTGAIKYVTSNEMHRVYFAAGNGESRLDDSFRQFRSSLQNNDFDVNTVDLIINGGVPSDANILVFTSPQKDLTNGETDSVKKYLENGGNIVFLFDPIDSGLKLPNFQSILSQYYISLGYDKIMETSAKNLVSNDNYTIVAGLFTNAIDTVDFDVKAIILPSARSINTLKNKSEDIAVTSLAQTSGTAKGVQLANPGAKNANGPFQVAVAAENQGALKPSKIVVIGNSQFLNDQSIIKFGIYAGGGQRFLINTMNWMENKKDDVLVDSKIYEVRTLNISNAQVNTSAVFLVIIFPLMIFALGTFVYLRRRHL